MAKRKIEIFTAGCPLCDETLKLVKEAVASCGCESSSDALRMQSQYGIKAMPAVVVDGEIIFEGKINRAQAALLKRRTRIRFSLADWRSTRE
jgi:Thioredoxin domain